MDGSLGYAVPASQRSGRWWMRNRAWPGVVRTLAAGVVSVVGQGTAGRWSQGVDHRWHMVDDEQVAGVAWDLRH
jgi:hypothetical protein